MKSIIATLIFFCFSAFAQTSIPIDAKFLDQFSEHHMDAIKMAKIAEKKAENPELKKMAQKMVKDQSKEIDQMKSWRKEFFSSAPKTSLEMPKMDMKNLETSKGHAFDMAFSEMMAKHHQDGISMVEQMSPEMKNEKVKHFALQAAQKQGQEKDKLEAMTEKK